MPFADPLVILSIDDRKAAIWRAAQLLNAAKGSEEEREFEMLTDAIVEFDLMQQDQAPVEIPSGFMRFIHGNMRPDDKGR